MEIIKLQGTEDTPGIILDAETETMEISGRSLPEDVAAFYEPALNWLKKYSENPGDKTIFNFKLTYFNTASSKQLLEILVILEELQKKGNDVLIRWHFPEDDEDMEEAGDEYADIVDVPFEKVSY
ncbi:MAG: DUF1987 domain-containing protein [Bacteroidales bacterium]|nr:DUF1987 domain-containing protein [Bacteroidales bacterium]